jgi:hypothetical protein
LVGEEVDCGGMDTGPLAGAEAGAGVAVRREAAEVFEPVQGEGVAR